MVYTLLHSLIGFLGILGISDLDPRIFAEGDPREGKVYVRNA